jgi:hypothetical protein
MLKKCINLDINITHIFPFNQILLDKKEEKCKRIRMFKMIFLIYKIIENKVDFQFGYNSKQISINFAKEDKEYFKNLFIIINLTKDFYFEKSKIIIKNQPEEKILLETKENNEDEDKISVTNWFYIICSKILNNDIQMQDYDKFLKIMEKVSDENIKIIDEMNPEFENEIKENKRTYGFEKLPSKSKDDLPIKKEENLIMKIWYLVLF